MTPEDKKKIDDDARQWRRNKPQRTTILKVNDRVLWLSINGSEETREMVVIGSTVNGHITFIFTHRNGTVIEPDRRSYCDIPIDRAEYMLTNDILRIINENDPEGNNRG